MKKNTEIHAVNRYEVTFNEPEFNAVYEFVRDASAAFAYGNGSCVTILRNGEFKSCIDTRYDKTVMKDFDKWCADFLAEYFDPEFEPVIRKI